MSTHTEELIDFSISDGDFSKMLASCGYRDMREHYGSAEQRLLRALLYRPALPGQAVPPHLRSKWDSIPQQAMKRKSMLASKYANDSTGIDAYIALLRIQIHWGVQLDEVLDRQLVQNPRGKASRIWHLLHHDFGYEEFSDIYIKGYILFILSDWADEEVYPQANTLNYFIFDNHFTMSLYTWHRESCLYNPKTYCSRTSLHADGDERWEPFDFLVEANQNKCAFNILTYIIWEGRQSLDDLYQELMAANLAGKFPLSSDDMLRKVVPIFGQPLFQTIYYIQNPKFPQRSIETMRSFKISGKVSNVTTSTGTVEWKEETLVYHLLAIANLKTDVVRFYGPGTAPIVESIQSPPNSAIFPTNKDNGMWKVGERDGEYLLVYRRAILGDGDEYIPPTKNAPEYMSPKELHDANTMEGTTFDHGLTPQMEDTDDSSSVHS